MLRSPSGSPTRSRGRPARSMATRQHPGSGYSQQNPVAPDNTHGEPAVPREAGPPLRSHQPNVPVVAESRLNVQNARRPPRSCSAPTRTDHSAHVSFHEPLEARPQPPPPQSQRPQVEAVAGPSYHTEPTFIPNVPIPYNLRFQTRASAITTPLNRGGTISSGVTIAPRTY